MEKSKNGIKISKKKHLEKKESRNLESGSGEEMAGVIGAGEGKGKKVRKKRRIGPI